MDRFGATQRHIGKTRFENTQHPNHKVARRRHAQSDAGSRRIVFKRDLRGKCCCVAIELGVGHRAGSVDDRGGVRGAPYLLFKRSVYRQRWIGARHRTRSTVKQCA